MTNKEDGGYYAIKGFVFQINTSILKILNKDDPKEHTYLEKIEDINDKDTVIQVKYKEKSNYYPSRIRGPVKNLLEKFKNDSEKEFVLYAYFKDEKPKEKDIDLDFINEVLGDSKDEYEKELKKEFSKKFSVIFSVNFDISFGNVIKKIKDFFDCADRKEAVIYYSMISDELLKKIINNPNKKENRKCNKEELKNILKDSKEHVFYSAYSEYLGKQDYFEMLNNKYFSPQNVTYFERFILIELNGGEDISEIKKVITVLEDLFYTPQETEIKSGAPYFYFQNLKPEKMKRLKTDLFKEGNVFRDGYPFENSDFIKEDLTETSDLKNKISLKFLNKEQDLKQVIEDNLGKRKEIYQFFLNEPMEIGPDIYNIKIQIDDLLDIKRIININN